MMLQSGDLRERLLGEGMNPITVLDYGGPDFDSRGLAGTVLTYKIAGDLAHRGASLEEVYNLTTWISTRLGTVGVGLEHCHVHCFRPFLAHGC